MSLFLKRLDALEQRIDSQIAGVWLGGETSGSPRTTTQRDLPSEISSQIEGIEARLRCDLGRHNEELISALRASLEKQIEKRIEPLQAEMAAQRASLHKLSEYSLRTEKNMQRLLEGLDRLVAPQNSRSNGTGPTSSHAD